MRLLSPVFGLLFVLAACGGGSAAARIDYANAVKYLQGVSVPADQTKGIELLKKAADGGNPEAQLMLGFFLMKGDNGLPADEAAAMKLFLAAAKQGNRDAQYNAGLAFVRAQGVKEDYKQAMKWFTAAALQDDPGAQYNLGVMYLNGEGAVKNALTSFAWFSIAEANGYDGAKAGKETARQAMTSDEAAEASSAVEKIRKQIVRPRVTTPVEIPSIPDQPL